VDFIQQILVVLALFVVLGSILMLLRSKGLISMNLPSRRSAPRRLKSVERLILTPHHSLHLVQYDDHTLVVGLSPAGCQLLTPVDSAEKEGRP
jgi:flagellar biogenesis protein FliO